MSPPSSHPVSAMLSWWPPSTLGPPWAELFLWRSLRWQRTTTGTTRDRPKRRGASRLCIPQTDGRDQFGPIHFWPTPILANPILANPFWCVSWWGPEGWGPEGWEARHFALFFLSRHHFALYVAMQTTLHVLLLAVDLSFVELEWLGDLRCCRHDPLQHKARW